MFPLRDLDDLKIINHGKKHHFPNLRCQEKTTYILKTMFYLFYLKIVPIQCKKLSG